MYIFTKNDWLVFHQTLSLFPSSEFYSLSFQLVEIMWVLTNWMWVNVVHTRPCDSPFSSVCRVAVKIPNDPRSSESQERASVLELSYLRCSMKSHSELFFKWEWHNLLCQVIANLELFVTGINLCWLIQKWVLLVEITYNNNLKYVVVV